MTNKPDFEAVIRRVFGPLCDEPRWVEWRTERRNGQMAKVPYIAGTNFKQEAKTNDPNTWRRFDDCRGDQRGIVFNGDGLAGVDLDACRDPQTGELTPWAQEFITEFGSYCEVSPSGTGVKVYTLGAPTELPGNVLPMPGEPVRGKQPQLEAYITTRYFAVTGRQLPGTPQELRPAPEAWAQLVERLREQQRQQGKQAAGRNDALTRYGGKLRRAGADDDALTAALTAANSRDSKLHPSFATEGPLSDNELERVIKQVKKFAPGDQRVVIEVHADRLDAAAEQAEQELVKSGKVYRRGNAGLALFAFVPAKDDRGRKTATARIRLYNKPLLHRELLQHARCVRYTPKGDKVVAAVPGEVLDMILASASPEFSELVGIIQAPTLRSDGSLLATEGYDPKTGLMLVKPPEMPPVPEHPTRADAGAALALLNDLLVEVPFEGESEGEQAGVLPALQRSLSRSVALAALMTPVVRAMMEFVPMVVLDAPAIGSGKATLVNMATMIATGRLCPVLGISSDRNDQPNRTELDKRIDGELLEGASFIYINNWNGVLDSALLCQALTRNPVKVRILGSTGNPEVDPTATNFFASGNNLEVGGDLVRRAIRSALDAQMEMPWTRKFKGNPVKAIKDDRGKFIHAILTVVRAHLQAGAPGAANLPPFAGFEDWSRLVRGALVWLGHADPVASQDELHAVDPRAATLDEIMEAWAEGLNEGKIPDTWLTARELAREVHEEINLGHPPFVEALRRATRTRGDATPDPGRLGNLLRRLKRTKRRGMRIEDAYNKKTKLQRWRLTGWEEFARAQAAATAERTAAERAKAEAKGRTKAEAEAKAAGDDTAENTKVVSLRSQSEAAATPRAPSGGAGRFATRKKPQ